MNARNVARFVPGPPWPRQRHPAPAQPAAAVVTGSLRPRIWPQWTASCAKRLTGRSAVPPSPGSSSASISTAVDARSAQPAALRRPPHDAGRSATAEIDGFKRKCDAGGSRTEGIWFIVAVWSEGKADTRGRPAITAVSGLHLGATAIRTGRLTAEKAGRCSLVVHVCRTQDTLSCRAVLLGKADVDTNGTIVGAVFHGRARVEHVPLALSAPRGIGPASSNRHLTGASV